MGGAPIAKSSLVASCVQGASKQYKIKEILLCKAKGVLPCLINKWKVEGEAGSG